MCRILIANLRRVPSSFLFVVSLIAVVCMASAGCHKTVGDQAAATDVMPLAARVDRLDGEVGIDRQNDTQDNSQDQSKTDWGKASVNTPVSVGSRVYVKDKSHAAIAFSGRNYGRLNPNTSLDVLSLSQRRTQLALRDGSGIFDVGALAPGELFEVATPNGAVDFQEPGLYQVGIDDRGSTLVSVLSGIAQVVGLAGSGQVGRGQLLTFGGDDGSEADLSQLDSGVCGNITNDYYSYRYPKTYDGRYADYQRYQDDPYYYDPYRRSTSYQYIPDDAEVAGLDDLDDNGDWEEVSGHGRCWHPRVRSDWAPYRDGSWYDDQPLGLTWVSNERWGWAPYHYGRWTNVNQRWYWVPGEIVSRPIYAPALVAFVPFTQDDRVGWVPLGPGDPYVSRYYDRNYQPQYIGSTTYINKNVNVTNIVNYNVPGAVTVVRTTEFTRVITPGSAEAADRALLARSRPVADPYAVPGLRDLAPNIRAHGSRVQVPETAHQALSRDVVTSQTPINAADPGKALKVKSVPEAEGNRKLQIKNSGQTVTVVQPNGLPASVPAQGGPNQTMTAQERQSRIDALAAQAAQGNKSAKREMRQLQDQQPAQEKVDRRVTAQAAPDTQQQQKQQQKAERKAAQQQTPTPPQPQQQKQQQKAERKAAQQQTPPPPPQQQKQQQKAERKAAQQQTPPPPPPQQQKQQQKAERKAAQQQTPPPPPQQQKQQQKAERKAAQQQTPPPPQQQQQKQQQKAESKAAQQQQTPPPPQQQQQKQQQKAERKAAQQQTPPPPPPQQQKQQQKAERKAAQQQQPPPPPPQQQEQQQKAERKAAQQQPPPTQTGPSKADKKAAKNKNGNNNGNSNQ
jgi:FecR protein